MHFNIHVICSIPDTIAENVIPKHMKDAELPKIGDGRIDIIICIHRILVDQEYAIRIKQNGETFELLEVFLKPFNLYTFDCLNLERYQ